MATNFEQDGNVINYENSGTAISSGDVVAVGATLGVALVDIAATTGAGAVQIDGVFNVPKVSAAVIVQGERLSWDVSAGAFDDDAATAAAGDVTGESAMAFESAGNGVTTIAVKFTGVPGTVT